MTEQKSLAKTSTGRITPFEPGNIQEAFRMAEMLAKSGIIPKAYRGKPADILVSIMIGRELGFASMQSLRGIHVIDGLVIMSAGAIVARTVQHPDCQYFRLVESTDKKATYETLRRGHPEPTQLTWAEADAKTAGLLGKDNWKKYPRAMYQARCAAALARAVYPDAMFGVYDESERLEIEQELDASTAARVATEDKTKQLKERIQEMKESLQEPKTIEVQGETVDTGTGEVLEEEREEPEEERELVGVTADDIPF